MTYLSGNERALMVFGRFQPVTIGHNALFVEIWRMFYERPYRNDFIFISPTVDAKKNPLTLMERYNFLSKLYPYHNFIANPDIKNPFDAICWLGEQGYSIVDVLAGPDRTEKYKTIGKYVQHPDPLKCIPNVLELNIISFGTRDPDSDDPIQQASGSAARQAVKDKDFIRFSDMLPRCPLEDQIQLYISIGRGLNGTATRTTTK